MLWHQQDKAHSIPVAQAFTSTTQAMVLVGHTTAEIAAEITLRPTAQAVPIASTFQQLTAPAPRANLASPEYHYSTPSRQQSRYDFGRNDGPSHDDYSRNDGNPRNYYGNRNSRFAMGKGKGKGRSFNTKGTWGAMPKDWDADQVVIPEYGTTQGISFYTISNLTTEGQSAYGENPNSLCEEPPYWASNPLHGSPTDSDKDKPFRPQSRWYSHRQYSLPL
jgi:hypothetical protein